MLDKVRQIIADITHNNLASVTAKSSSKNLGGWDSVAQINIIVAIEEEFGIRFDPEDIHALNSVDVAVQITHFQSDIAQIISEIFRCPLGERRYQDALTFFNALAT